MAWQNWPIDRARGRVPLAFAAGALQPKRVIIGVAGTGTIHE